MFLTSPLASRACFDERTGCSVSDYYAILGLDSTASQESIRVAYRRLARETHPDRNIHATETDNKAQSAEMARLNEAYAVLADSRRRREYDDSLRTKDILNTTHATPKVEIKTGSKSSPATGQRAATRPRHDADLTVVKEFGNHLRGKFLADRKNFPWKQKEAEGFDWALECAIKFSHYLVAARAFGLIDPAAVKKVTNYAEIAFAEFNRPLRKSNFLFVLPFQNMTEWDSVSVQCQRFVAGEGLKKPSGVTIGVVLLDLQHGRALRFGSKSPDKRLEQLVQWIGTPE
jgi:curved DNA-binding protein CbpA